MHRGKCTNYKCTAQYTFTKQTRPGNKHPDEKLSLASTPEASLGPSSDYLFFFFLNVPYPPFPWAFNHTVPCSSQLPLFLFWPSTTYSFFFPFSFFIVVKHIWHKICHFNHCYMCNSIAFITFTLLGNHHYSLFPKLFIMISSSKTIPSFQNKILPGSHCLPNPVTSFPATWLTPLQPDGFLALVYAAPSSWNALPLPGTQPAPAQMAPPPQRGCPGPADPK